MKSGKGGKPELAKFDEHRRAVGVLNPMRDKNGRTYRGVGRGATKAMLSPRLIQKAGEGKTSYEFSWRVKLIITNMKVCINMLALSSQRSRGPIVTRF